MPYTRRFDEVGSGDVALAGGKGANLGELTRAGLPVPEGFVVTTAAYDAFVSANGLGARIAEIAGRPAAGDTAAFAAAAAEIGALFRAGTLPEDVAKAVHAGCEMLGAAGVAVRSSATAEDLAEASFAGQQDTYLNVRGDAAVLAAVVDCWASLWTARAMAYRARQGIAPEAVSLAVVIQRMVAAESAGVMFTANPANGRRDQVAIGAAWGLGESVVSGTVSTDDVVVDKATGRAVSRHVADKTEMTVYAGTGTDVASGTEQRPVPPPQRLAPVLDDAAVAELAGLGSEIERHYGAPQDIEWARAGGRTYVVQSRPITALPEPTADPPTSWPVPDPDGWYFRASIVEQLPDPLTPLFADLIDGSVRRSLGTLLAEAFGTSVLAEDDMGLPTINGYAYYFYRRSGLRRMVVKSPAALWALAGQSRAGTSIRGGVRGWRERSHPQYVLAVRGWAERDPADLASAELLDGVLALLDAATVYYTAVQSVIPLAATSELTFRAFYDRLVRRAGGWAGWTFLVGFDSQPVRADKSLWDLAVAARADPGLAAAARDRPDELLRALRDGSTPDGADPQAWQRWRARFQQHLDRFGHAFYNLDFAEPVPADDPGLPLQTIRFYLDGHGTDPYERQQRFADQRDRQAVAVRAQLDPARRVIFDRLLRWAQETGPIREDALADVGLAWPAMRRMLLELGRRLVAAGAIAEPADVFWLRHDELRAAIATDRPAGHHDAVAERRMLWRGRKLATAPQLLPETGWMPRLAARFMPAADQRQSGATITGTGAGSGQVTAPARVLGGPADFGLMRPGEVLVARITTPAWTTLFAMAAAVVTDVGGPLSHSSIVAREYGIPAVLGTGSGTARIRTGQLIRVDGDAGTVTLLDEEEIPASPADTAAGRGRLVALAAAGAAVATVWVWRRRRR